MTLMLCNRTRHANTIRPDQQPTLTCHLTRFTSSSYNSLLHSPNSLLFMATTQVCFFYRFFSIHLLIFTPFFRPMTALRLGWRTHHPLDICLEVHPGLGRF